MCEFCVKHGEGKKWYLNAKNYSNDLLSDIRRRRYVRDHFQWLDKSYQEYLDIMKYIPVNAPIIGPYVRRFAAKIIKSMFIGIHWSQIAPFEDIQKILDITNSITRVPCICQKVLSGREERSCFLISLDPGKTGIADVIDQSFFGGPDVAKFEAYDKDKTLEFFKESERKGMVHSVWALNAPFIGILCNCSVPAGCMSLNMVMKGTPFAFKGEYVAVADIDKCSGCAACISQCQFGALKVSGGKLMIDEAKCFGCGICRVACRKNAISLKDRSLSVKASNLW